MDCLLERDGAVLTAKPRGLLNAKTSPELEEMLESELDGVSELVMDLRDVENISSMGLRLLLSLYRRMEKQGAMRVVNARGNVADVFKATGFDAIF